MKSELNRLVPDSGLPSLTPREAAPLLIGMLVYVLVGYALFYASWLLEIPSSDNPSMAQLTEKIAALRMVDRVALVTGKDGMPMKVVMLYLLPGTILLIVWGMAWSIRPQVLHTVLFRCKHGTVSTLKLAAYAPFALFYVELSYSVINSDCAGALSWHDFSMYASTFGSVTQVLLLTLSTAAFQFCLLPICIHLLSTAIDKVRGS